MSSIVLELQQEVLKPECDILNALRKAHLIASKLKLQKFDKWIMHELNGYPESEVTSLPEYRKVTGSLKAWNPYKGWIPMIIEDKEIETMICTKSLFQSISVILESHKISKTYVEIPFTGNVIAFLDSISTMPFNTNYELRVGVHQLKKIIDAVANCLLEWTITLEKEGILGEGMRFSQEEANMAEKISQTINNYYGTVVNGDVKQSQVVSGDHNAILFTYEQVDDILKKVKEAIRDELPSGEDRETAEELIAEVETKLSAQAKPKVIRAALVALREFLVCSGANIAGGLILQYLQRTP